MFIVEFEFNDIITKMQCKKEDKLRDIFYEFSNKIEININDLLFLYKGKTVNEDFTFSQLINFFEHTGTDIKFIVYRKKQINQQLIKSKEPIYPICRDNIIIKIKDYKIYLYDCKNNHIINDVLLNKYENTQKIIDKRLCDKCKINITENQEIYLCRFCNMNLCRICKVNHNSSHKIIDNEYKNFICDLHNEKYILYCEICKMNICRFCEISHYGHNIISYKNLISNKDTLTFEINQLKKKLNKLYNNIYNIIIILNKFMENMRIYYRIYHDIIIIWIN